MPMRETFKKCAIISNALALITLVIACLVLLGWHIQSVALVQLAPSLVPMQFNTALGFIFSSMSLLTFNAHHKRVSAALALFISSLGFFTLVQYIFYTDLGIDQAFMEHFVTEKTSHPGRMAPNTALCFSLFGLLMWLISTLTLKKFFQHCANVLCLLILAFSLTALFGYVTNQSTAYGWGHLTRMALHTSLGFMLIGTSALLTTLKLSNYSQTQKSNIYPAYVLFYVVMLFVMLYIALSNQTKINFNKSINVNVHYLGKMLEKDFSGMLIAVDRFIDRTLYIDKTQKMIAVDAKNYVEDFAGVKAIFFLDGNVAKAIYPLMKESTISKWKTLCNAKPYLPLKDTNLLARFASPDAMCLKNRNKSIGFILSIKKTINDSLKSAKHFKLNVSLRFRDKIIFDSEKKQKTPFQQTIALPDPFPLSLTVNPSKTLLADYHSKFYFYFFLSLLGIVLGCALSAAIRYWLLSKKSKQKLLIALDEKTKNEEKIVASEQSIRLIYEVTTLASEASDFNETIKDCLKIICELFELEIGHCYLVIERDGIAQLEPSLIWFEKSPELSKPFKALTMRTTFKKGEGIPGKVWETQQVEWYKDISNDESFIRKTDDCEHSVKGAFSFPIMVEQKTIAVVEFFSYETVKKDNERLQALTILSDQLGRILERKNAEQSLKEAEELSRLLLNFAGEGIYGIDLDGNTMFVNPAACKILGYSEEELIGKPAHQTIHYAYPDGSPYPHSKCPMYVSFKEGITNHIDDEVLWHKNGYAIPVRYTSTPIIENNKNIGTVVTFFDITAEQEARYELEVLAHFDKLTGLLNRHSFLERLNQVVCRANRKHEEVAVMFLDLDNFKNINDTLGHTFGDQLLVKSANRLKKLLRQNDYLARIGGDEFCVIFEDFADVSHLKKIAKSILSELCLPFHIDGNVLQCTISIGIAVYPFGGHTPNQLLGNADIAMYRAKELGKNQVEFFTEELNQRVKRIQLIESNLADAIKNDEFYLLYQPIYNLETKKIDKIEALIRWENKEVGFCGPDEFIGVAELSNLIDDIGQWVFARALDDFKTMLNCKNLSHLKLSINVSAKQLANKHFLHTLQTFFATAEIKPSQIILEVTETAVMSDIDQCQIILQLLCTMGFEVALDDFGTGYTSILYLKRLPINYLKIDKEFIKDISEDENDKVIVKTIIALSRSLGLTCVAEGVETKEQLSFLEHEKCQLFQGYLYSKPLSPSELMKQNR